MTIQKDVRRAKRAMQRSPTDGVLACVAILGRAPGNGPARRLLRVWVAIQRRSVLNDIGRLIDAGEVSHALRVLVPLGRAHLLDPGDRSGGRGRAQAFQ